jgi:uncharacterized protein YdaU (DUF1376 family)
MEMVFWLIFAGYVGKKYGANDMNFYDHHIGDYTTATIHLTLAQHGAYRRLMDIYYGTEKPISLDFDRVCKSIPTRGKQEEDIVRGVLEEFFDMKVDGWHNEHCDNKIRQWQKNRENGNKSKGRPPLKREKEPEKHNPTDNPDNNPNHNPNKTQKQAQTKPSHLPYPNSQIPLPISQNPSPKIEGDSSPAGDLPNTDAVEKPPKTPDIPYDEILAAYEKICIGLPKCRVLTDDRKKAMARIFRVLGNDMNRVRLLFTKANASAFVRGEKNDPKGSHPHFRPDFSWVINEKNAAKILEDKFDDKNPYSSVDDLGDTKMEGEDG